MSSRDADPDEPAGVVSGRIVRRGTRRAEVDAETAQELRLFELERALAAAEAERDALRGQVGVPAPEASAVAAALAATQEALAVQLALVRGAVTIVRDQLAGAVQAERAARLRAEEAVARLSGELTERLDRLGASTAAVRSGLTEHEALRDALATMEARLADVRTALREEVERERAARWVAERELDAERAAHAATREELETLRRGERPSADPAALAELRATLEGLRASPQAPRTPSFDFAAAAERLRASAPPPDEPEDAADGEDAAASAVSPPLGPDASSSVPPAADSEPLSSPDAAVAEPEPQSSPDDAAAEPEPQSSPDDAAAAVAEPVPEPAAAEPVPAPAAAEAHTRPLLPSNAAPAAEPAAVAISALAAGAPPQEGGATPVPAREDPSAWPTVEELRAAASAAPPVLPARAEEPVVLPLRKAPAGGPSWLLDALRSFAELAPEDAERLLVELLPAQGGLARRPVTYDLVVTGGGAHRVALDSDRAEVAPRAAGALGADARLAGTLPALAPLVAGGAPRRWPGVEIEGRRKVRRVLRARRRPMTLAGLAEVGAAPDPALVLALLAHRVEPAWTAGRPLTVDVREGARPPVRVTVPDGGRPQVAGLAPTTVHGLEAPAEAAAPAVLHVAHGSFLAVAAGVAAPGAAKAQGAVGDVLHLLDLLDRTRCEA